jgi:ABC-type Fe3+ transport system substrate-binding protein
MRFLRTIAVVTAWLLIATFGAVTANAQSKIRILSPHPKALQDEFTAGFKKWMQTKYKQNVEIEWLDQGGTSQIMRFILSEFKRSPNGINMDIFFGGGTDSYLQLTRENLLEVYRVPDATLKTVGKEVAGVPVYDPQYRWYGVALSGFGIMYNKLLQTRLKLPAAKTWEDLANPALLGRIATPDPRNSGSGHMIYEIILQAYGWEKGWRILTEMAGNVKSFTAGASDVPNEVALGNVVYGPVIDFYAYAQMVKTGSDKIVYVTPQGLSVINPDAIGILKGAPNKTLAQRFVEYCLTTDAQKLLMLPVGAPGGPKNNVIARSSVLPALYKELGSKSLITSSPFSVKNIIRYDAAKGSTRWDLVNDLYGSLIIDAHRELTTAWRTVSKATPDARAAFSKMPLTEAQANALAAQWNEEDYALKRKQTISEWREFARKRYADATKMR